MARIVITTDAWHPQVNGVVRTLDTTARKLREMGHVVEVIEPSAYPQIPVPFYPEICIAVATPGAIANRLTRFRPDSVHISTEGPLGFLVRRECLRRGWKFSTTYHTKFPEYLRKLARVPEAWSYRLLRWFHNASSSLKCATPSLERDLLAHGFTAPIRRWSRGVDLELFQPAATRDEIYPRPVLLYVGRVSKEKGIEDFLHVTTPGTKVVVGDGPARADLERRFPDAKFLGYRKGAELAACYANADLFVFPSKTDTFGLVMIEALVCGTPVAGYPVTGPIDIVTRPELGALHENLGTAIELALQTGNREACVAEGRKYTWENCTNQFVASLVPIV